MRCARYCDVDSIVWQPHPNKMDAVHTQVTLISSYLILSYLISSYLILSYTIYSYLIWSYLILSYLILSILILSYLIYLIWSYLFFTLSFIFSAPLGLAGIRYAHDGQGDIKNGFLRQKQGNGNRPSQTRNGWCQGESEGDSSKQIRINEALLSNLFYFDYSTFYWFGQAQAVPMPCKDVFFIFSSV